MYLISLVLSAILICLALGQAIYVFSFSKRIKDSDRALLEDNDCPMASIIMCIRGQDPHLESCLRSIHEQDYPQFEVHLVLDHKNDPAIPLADKFCQNNEHCYLHVLETISSSCSMKCNSLLLGMEKIDSDSSFVAFLDSDTVPQKNWLRSLATGLSNTDVGVVSGIRWYAPPGRQLGTLVRYVWNAAAIVQMVVYRIAWGGTLAIKKDVFERTDLLERWKSALCEDTMLSNVLRQTEFKTEFRSDLFVVNRESGSLREVVSWLSRQLLTARLYHPCWMLVAIHAISTSAAIFLSLLMLIPTVIKLDITGALILAMGLLLSQVANALMLLKIGQTVSESIPQERLSNPGLTTSLFMAPLTQACYLIATLKSMFTRRIQWRGIEYDIAGPWKIAMQQFKPYTPTPETRRS